MGRGLQQRAQGIAKATGKQNGQPGKAAAERLGEKKTEHAAEEEIACKVTDIGVQPEGGQGPPPFAVRDQARLRGPRCPPVP